MASKPKLRWETLDKSNTELTKLMLHFEVHNRTEGKSLRTVGWYNEALGMFLRWLKDQELPTALQDIGEPEVRQFLQVMVLPFQRFNLLAGSSLMVSRVRRSLPASPCQLP
jgi:hypothetical protein